MKQTTAIEILKYWLQCIRTEEALMVRPKSWRPDGGPERRVSINMKSPTPGRTYFKISFEEIAELISPHTPTIVRPFNHEIAELFETWLAGQYRMPHQLEDEHRFMVSCPVVQLRYGDLAGLVRFTVGLKFSYGDEDFVVPSIGQRRKGRFPIAPTQVHLRRIPPEEGFPFFIDGRLIRRELCATGEEMDDWYRALSSATTRETSPSDFLGQLAGLLDGQPPSRDTMETLERLTRAMSDRLRSFERDEGCYRVAIVMDTGRGKTTWHLQRDLQALIQQERFRTSSALWTYLSHQLSVQNEQAVQGLFNSPGLTNSQEAAVKQFLGSSYLAVQGPPGTGKTTLVLHLSAHLLVERIAAFAKTNKMPTDITVISSTNNRAVDNVIGGLILDKADNALPLALRAGSRRICIEILAPKLAQVMAWLNEQRQSGSAEEKEKKLRLSLLEFSKTMTELDALLAPERARQAALEKQTQLTRELEKQGAPNPQTVSIDNTSLQTVIQTQKLVKRLEKRFDSLSIQCEGRPTAQRLRRIHRLFETKIERLLENVSKALADIGLNGVTFQKPDRVTDRVKIEIESWEVAAETGLSEAEDRLIELGRMRVQKKRAQQRERIEQQLSALEIPEVRPLDEGVANRLRIAAFNQALNVRQAWAACHAESLLDAVKSAHRAAETAASLRRFSRTRRKAFEQLKALFPVWGTTLLSMGNLFDESEESVERVIIDEAGQCHPAYAISALMRCRRALVLGDVHQLSPIFGLTSQDEAPIFEKVLRRKLPDADIYRVFDRAHTSAQRLAEQAMTRPLRLTEHFRCQKEIIEISNRLCRYDLTVHTPRRSLVEQLPLLDRPVRFFSVNGEQTRLGGSWWNEQEAGTVVSLMDTLLYAGIPADDIAIITPYRGQLFKLRRVAAARGIPIEASPELLDDADPAASLGPTGLALGTVHRFQGGERRIVVFTTVLTESRSLPFINERVNLINVAVSRAREHLLIVGHESTLARGRLSRLLLPSHEC